MNILHLLSNYRWTERAEPAVLLAWAEHQAGARVTVASGGARKPETNSIQPHVLGRGLESVLFELPKHFRIGPLLRDARALREYVATRPMDVIHCHMVNAHTTAVVACRKTPRRPRIVRTCYEPEGIADTIRERMLMRRTDGLIVNTEEAQSAMVARYPWLRDRVAVIPPGIDLDRFSSDRVLDCPPEPAEFPANAFIVGMVSRLRAARRIDLVVRAVGALARECPDLHLMIVGQGGSEEKVREAVTQPAIDAGCADRVHLVGYRKGDTLVAAYRRMNVLAYPEPGTDRSCRTVREAMAAGLPIVAARVGYLPHLVENDATGFLTEQTAEGFAAALRRLYQDRDLARRFAENSLVSAVRRFGLDAQANASLNFYRGLHA